MFISFVLNRGSCDWGGRGAEVGGPPNPADGVDLESVYPDAAERGCADKGWPGSTEVGGNIVCDAGGCAAKTACD